MAFLTAEWRNLALITYAIDPAILPPILPPGCTADLKDGRAFVSLVAFDFMNTRVKGICWFGHTCFPEINLRYYVRHGEERGVSFVCELVPSVITAWIARSIYNEPYFAARMRSYFHRGPQTVEVGHTLSFRGRRHRLTVRADAATSRPEPDSLAHFLKEHQWGFVRSRSGLLRRYEVTHPEWDVYENPTAEIDVDFAVYGPRWAFLSAEKPCSVVLAVGSEIAVFPHAPVAP